MHRRWQGLEDGLVFPTSELPGIPWDSTRGYRARSITAVRFSARRGGALVTSPKVLLPIPVL